MNINQIKEHLDKTKNGSSLFEGAFSSNYCLQILIEMRKDINKIKKKLNIS